MRVSIIEFIEIIRLKRDANISLSIFWLFLMKISTLKMRIMKIADEQERVLGINRDESAV